MMTGWFEHWTFYTICIVIVVHAELSVMDLKVRFGGLIKKNTKQNYESIS